MHAIASRLAEAGLLTLVIARFAALDLSEQAVSDAEMGSVFDSLVRRSAETTAGFAGEHFTPPDVIALLAMMIVAPDAARLARRTAPIRVYDPVCGAGGSLMALWAAAGQLSPVELFGQDLNYASSALTSATLLMHGLDPGGIALGDTLSNDAHPEATFDYMVAAPPFGVEWKKVAGEVKKEAALGDAGRFGAGLPRITDSSLLFLQHMLAKMRPPEDGAVASPSTSTAARCSRGRLAAASPRSAVGSSRTTFSKPWWPCLSGSSTTHASLLHLGSNQSQGAQPRRQRHLDGLPPALRGDAPLDRRQE